MPNDPTRQAVEPAQDEVERVATAICKSGKFETGRGTCAAICMDQLGDARARPCSHAVGVHSKLVDSIIAALRPAQGKPEDVREMATAEPPLRQEMDDQDGLDAMKAFAQPDGLSWNELKKKYGLESPSPILPGEGGEMVRRLSQMPPNEPARSRIGKEAIALIYRLSAAREAVLEEAAKAISTIEHHGDAAREWERGYQTAKKHAELSVRALKAAGSK